ncbi:hypothetical protein [Streptomyces sp. NPDC047981]|uniref:hypothetical protein n=1 Tax=Streptomyces sp. NPDC047981 TaxID=3154610 RepID=UPI003427204A
MSELYTAESGNEARDAQGDAARDAPSDEGVDDEPIEPAEPDAPYEESVESEDLLEEADDAEVPEEPDAPEQDDVDPSASSEQGIDADEQEPLEPEDPDSIVDGDAQDSGETPLLPDDVDESEDESESVSPVESTDQMSEAAAHLDERKLATDSGEAFYGLDDAQMREMASKLEPEQGAFTVDLHGTPNSVEVDGRSISAEELGAYLTSDQSDWDGEPVRLMSCETGQGEEPFAQELADNLGVPVTAPTELAWSDSQGNSWVASGVFDEYGDMQSTWPPDGEWVTFEPNDKN